jgi:hypothetical protein
MKCDENEVKLNLNESLREVREKQKSRVFKGMIQVTSFFTQTLM